MKNSFLVYISTILLLASSAFAGPGEVTPFPFGLSPEELVGFWSNPAHPATITIQHVKAVRGQSEKLFVVIAERNNVSKGYLYFAQDAYCGEMFEDNGQKSLLCLRGRFGLIAVEGSATHRLYFSKHQRMAGR